MKRDLFILAGSVIVAVGISAFAFFSDGGDLSNMFRATASQGTVPFIEIARGSQSVIERRVNYVITSPDGLSKLWDAVDAAGIPPEVDFKTHAVLAVFAGDETTPSITIAKIEDSDTRMVSVALAKSSEKCALTKDKTPYEMVLVPATSLPLAHKDVITTIACQN